MVWLAVLLLAGSAALSGCLKPEPAAPAPAPAPAAPAATVDPAPDTPSPVEVVQSAEVAVAPAVEEVADTVQEIVDDIPAPEPVAAPPPSTPISDAAIKLLVDTEVGGERLYRRKFTRPVWPGGASGVTIGIGSDLGHTDVAEIRYDWAAHPQLADLEPAAGIRGKQARILTAQMQQIVTEFPLALDVFLRNDVLQYYRIAVRAFPGLEETGPNVQGTIVSLVFNRGGAMPKHCAPGTSRYEMCKIRDECIPLKLEAGPCVARWERTMKRVWKGRDIERGMNSRREQEAKLAELPDV